MNVTQFFDRWSIRENPFRGEEARHDEVLARMNFARPGVPTGDGARPTGSVHSDFDKVLGELTRPSTSIVFGEKGSGKTAIRLQIEDRVREHNRRRPDSKTLLIPLDDLNPFVAELDRRYGGGRDGLAAMRKVRLVDHMDAILSIAADRIAAALFREGPDRPAADLGEEPLKAARKLAEPLRRDLLLLQAVYDPADTEGRRTARLRRLLRLPPPRELVLWRALTAAGWVPAVLFAVAYFVVTLPGSTTRDITGILFLLALLLYAAVLVKRLAWDRFALARTAGRARDEMRWIPRGRDALAASFRSLERADRRPGVVPLGDGDDEARYAMFERLRRVVGRFGYTGILVVIDRVDEPTLVNGDADKMRALMWPLFSNKFLQQERFGVKMLLPIELRHALFKESAQFFQEARLDKQSLIERLTWTGPMLYDLCNARLAACRDPEADPINLIDLFAEDVTRSDVVDALDQMHQPRDAFKFLYRCINEHCSNVTADQNEWRIPKLVLDQVRRAEADRVQQLYRGIRPA